MDKNHIYEHTYIFYTKILKLSRDFGQSRLKNGVFLNIFLQYNIRRSSFLQIPRKKGRARQIILLCAFFIFQAYPPDRVMRIEKPCSCKAVSYPSLYCSQRPAFIVETSQSRKNEGGLQTVSELCFGLLFLFVGFLCPSSQIKQASHLSFEKGVPKNFISVKFSIVFLFIQGNPHL